MSCLGVILALLLRGSQVQLTVWPFVAGALVAVLIASANYVINEWLDRDSDALHPTKSARTAVQIRLDGSVVWAQWFVLVALGLAIAASSSKTMLFVAIAFAAQGIVYNVRPLRSKDYPYVDVLTELVNNPLRLMIGWAMVDPSTLPPGSIILGYWLGGAFLMGAKRLSEYREIVSSHGRDLLVRYRASFAGYDETKLASSCLIYALLSAMALAIFFVKYRIEYIFVLPRDCSSIRQVFGAVDATRVDSAEAGAAVSGGRPDDDRRHHRRPFRPLLGSEHPDVGASHLEQLSS